MQHGNGGTNNAHGRVNPNNRDINSITPTPAPRNGENAEKPTDRYVPPMFRAGERPIRPESSMSNATFASQPPMPITHPNGHYAFHMNQLTRQMAQVDPFQGAPPPPVRAYGNTNGATRPNFGRANGTSNGIGAPHPNSRYASGTPNGSNPGLMSPPSHASSARDSVVLNSYGYSLAQRIRSGAADDPTDPGYGNPAVRPRVQSNTQRGQVVAAAGQSTAPIAFGEPNIDGNAAAFIRKIGTPIQPWLNQLAMGYKPTIGEMFDALPLTQACLVAKPSTAGVIKIRNIPYATSRAEITAFLSRNAQIIQQPPGSSFYAVHIMMDRQSGKTMDAFIEVETPKEAAWIVNQFRRRVQAGRTSKLGDRTVEVEQSSQQEFMGELFPRAKNVTWNGASPIVNMRADFYYDGVQSSGFSGFLQDEEIVHMAKHAETPQRSPFAQRSLIRTFECLITTLHKYPWYAVDHVLIRERDALFDTTLKTVTALMNLLSKIHNNQRNDPTQPTKLTLKELACAALTCPGFSEGQKSLIVTALKQGGHHQVSKPTGMNLYFGGGDSYSHDWPLHILVKKPGASDELVEFLASLLRDATNLSNGSLADRISLRDSGAKQGYFGHLNIDYGRAKNLGEVGRAEFRVIEDLLRKVLPPGSGTASRTGSLNS